MKRLGREYDKLETLNLFSLLPLDQQLTINDPERKISFFARLGSGLELALKSESTLHGIRVQAMFQLMVASFGKVSLIKQEDSGECYHSSDEPIQVPDFRVVQADGKPLLVETKNHCKLSAPFSVRERDLDALVLYSTLLRTPLKVAIYWARWNTWTLNKPDIFERDGRRARVEFMDALATSHMADLGDLMIGTKSPLMLRLPAAMDKPRSINSEGELQIHLAGWELYCAGKRLEDEVEKLIAFYMMLYGKWQDSGPGAELDSDGLPTAILYSFEPEERHAGQGFEIIGSLSSMFSAFYNSVTLEEGRVANFAHYDDPSKLAPIIPPDYKGKALPLWRLIQQPNVEKSSD